MYKRYMDRISIQMVREPGYKEDRILIMDPKRAHEVASAILKDLDREHMIAIILDNKKQLSSIHVVSVGTVDGTQVHPREVFKAAILANASAIIIAHNHPSGNPSPSEADRECTKRIVDAGKLIGIQVVDHIVVGDDSYWSFSEHDEI